MELIDYLKENEIGRERSNKNKVIAKLAWEKYHSIEDTEDGGYEILPKNHMADMVGEILSLDRKWRKILEENEDLRGTDYKEKDILEQNKMLELGYEPGYNQKLKI